ncbi:uncharacterized protein LOC131306984 [Rhododendron vialii]|uniref:uncharacterized protein LOC131306984 n=1 Tax=Rhododendron vialii TaxID=182163 RepID=UPI00265F400F|nr:uncharacterized protein LOC131306984 [Rhododendron vialii]
MNGDMLEIENTNPPWLKQLLKANFYAVCKTHEDYRCNQCNRYCIECIVNFFCEYCLDDHENLQIIQIRRSSLSNAVRVDDIKNHINLGGVQTYMINKRQIVFLNSRPYTRLPYGVTKICNICRHSLPAGNFSFCCLSCKTSHSIQLFLLTSNIINWKGANILPSIFTYREREAISRDSTKQTFAVETELSTGEIDDSFQIDQSSTPNRKFKVRRLHKLLAKSSVASSSAAKQVTSSIYPATTPMFNHVNSKKRKGIP